MQLCACITICVYLLISAATGQTKPAGQPAPQTEKIITRQEADELFRSVDELTRFASTATGLPIKTPVKRELTSRDQLEKFLLDKLNEDEEAKRLEHSELVIKKFGLLPPDFQLRPFLVKLLRDQVAGYYDSKKKTVYLLDWLSADVQRPVLAHELSHALQDQRVDLDKWMEQARKDAERHNKAQADAEYDEASVARSAVTEGQAMAVLVEYLLSQAGRTIEDSPGFVDTIVANLENLGVGPEAGSAPLLIRESLIFPYRDGLKFTYELMKSGGKAKAFEGALTNPPATTHEVLSPRSYLSGEHVPPLNLPDLRPVFKDAYVTYDIGSVGEFDLGILVRELGGGPQKAAQLSPAWRGGIYLAVVPKGKTPVKISDVALVYLSRWSSPEKAQAFADFYRFAKKPDVVGEVKGEYALVLESLDPAFATQVQKSVFQSLSLTRVASGPPRQDLTSRIAGPLAPARAMLVYRWLAELSRLAAPVH